MSISTPALVSEGLARGNRPPCPDHAQKCGFQHQRSYRYQLTAGERVWLQAIREYGDYIQAETLGDALENGEAKEGYHQEEFEIDGEKLALGVKALGLDGASAITLSALAVQTH